ncbi:FecR domain-containing protein [Methylotenera versatilis]|uniref:FecR domain-containing protein n=1 Tax=Methylotenera versatilis TaxID=1055487 RepID=UPI000690BA60|nr:FecR domain-containing protein [Methylotenera versatilis]
MQNPFTHSAAIHPKIVQEAINWMVKLQSGIASSQDLEGCNDWRGENPQHEAAWQQLQSLTYNLKAVPSNLAHATLEQDGLVKLRVNVDKKLQDRRSALKSIAVLAGVGTFAFSGYRFAPWQQMLADHATGVGEQRTVMLADGSRMMLNTNSAVNIYYDRNQRLIELVKGEVLITTAHESAALYRPLSVQTAQGNVRAMGTHFLVRQQENTTLAAVYEGALEVRPKNAALAIHLNAGQQLIFSANQTGKVTPADPNLNAWSDGVLIANNMRLADFVEELDRYWQGKITCDESAKNITISGVFPLKDTDKVIETLQQTLPIDAVTRMRYWTVLVKRS